MKKTKSMFICIIGIDGSGKTTLAKRIMSRLAERGVHVRYMWGGYECIFLRPLIVLGKKIFLRGTDPFIDYSNYYNSIRKATKNSIISRIYNALTLAEYYFQIFFKIRIPLLFGKNIISDRYVYDIFINIAANLGYYSIKLKRSLKKFLSFCPNPDIVFFIDVPEEIAFKRKNDIPSLEYLVLRRRLYLDIIRDHNIVALDGTKSIDELENIVINYIVNNLERRNKEQGGKDR